MGNFARILTRVFVVCSLVGILCLAQVPQGNQGKVGASAKVGPSAGELQQIKESVKKLEDQIREFEKRAKATEGTVEELQKTQWQHNARLSGLEQHNRYVELDPADLGKFQRLDTDIGSFLVSIESVTPYLDGVRVKLQLGNLMSGTYNGFSLKAKWWIRLGPEGNNFEEYLKSMKTKEDTYTQSLYPGVWNNIDLILSATKPEEFGSLELAMTTKTVSFSR